MSSKSNREPGKLYTATDVPGKIYPALMHNPERTDGAKVLYAHMHWRYGRNEQNFESQKSMARHLGVSEKTIANRILELEYDDWVVVEIQERSAQSGNFTTPFYHVFERQDDCRKFRAEYAPEGKNVIRPKSDEASVPKRVSRKGKGGLADEKNRHRLNTDTDGRLNKNSTRGQNKNSDKPLTVKHGANATDEHTSPSGETANPNGITTTSGDKLTFMELAVIKAFKLPYGKSNFSWGYMRQLTNFFTGKIKTPGKKSRELYDFQFDERPLEPKELLGLALWYGDNFEDVAEFRKLKAETHWRKWEQFSQDGEYRRYVRQGKEQLKLYVALLTAAPAELEPDPPVGEGLYTLEELQAQDPDFQPADLDALANDMTVRFYESATP